MMTKWFPLQDYLRRTGFHHQLTAIVTTAILGLALFSSLINSWEASRRMQGYMVEQGRRITENLARQSTLALLYHSPDNAREGVATTLAFPDVLQVQITDASKRVLLSQAQTGTTTLAYPPFSAKNITSNSAVLEQETSDHWYFGAPVYGGQTEDSPFDVQERKPLLLGYVHVILSKGTLTHLVFSLLLANFAITFSFAAILLWIVHLLARRIIRPLNALSHLMGRAEAGELGMRVVPEGPKDLIDMATAFNKMMDVLEAREEELKRSRDEAVRLALIKTQFAATVSHEVRTPLNGMIGMLDLLRETPLAKKQKEYTEVAWRSARSLMQLINHILDFSKMEAGKLILEEIDFDLRELLEEVIDLFAKSLQEKNLELGYLIGKNVPDQIKGDALRLRQVLTNLIGNAVKFTDRGEIAISVTCIHGEGGCFDVRFEVIDTGIGMSRSATEHIFESFAQADRSTTRKYGGTGLGLAICKQLVELMNGEIGVATEIGHGTTFWFTIRCQSSENPASLMALYTTDTSLKGTRTLIVEKSIIIPSFLDQNLTRYYGMTCHVVRNGTEALNELMEAHKRHSPYALIITSASVTDEEGVSLAKCIRANHHLSDIRVMILENASSLTLNRTPSTDEADNYLTKPLQLKRVLEITRRVMAEGMHKPENTTRPALPSGESTLAVPKKYRVLVTDDNHVNRLVAAGMLAKYDCDYEYATNGLEAVEAARNTHFDLIFMDCSMPEMDGYEATSLIRSHEKSLGRHTPIIALTANVQEGDMEKCLLAGMDDYLPKPITLVGLRPKLEYWLGTKDPRL